MRQFEQKRKIKKFIYSKFVILVLVFILGFLIKGNIGIYTKYRESLSRKNSANVQLVKLSDRQKNIEEKIVNLETRVGIEEELRNRFSIAKEGEKMVVIIEDKNQQFEVKIPEDENFIEKTFSWFKGLNLLE
jgi:cell division protein FtsB